MKLERIEPGSIIQHRGTKERFTVIANYGTRLTAVKTADVTNPHEWRVVVQIFHCGPSPEDIE